MSPKDFFLFCSGIDRSILDQCPSDENKYLGIGATVFFTGVLALFSSAYALYTVFDSYVLSIIFGLIWGLMIFNLDRYIVSSMKSRGSFFRDFFVAAPRLLLAVLLALVISKPLELKIFEKEINAELIVMEQEAFKAQEEKVQERYLPTMAQYRADMALLQSEIDSATAQRNRLALIAQQEADGTGGSGYRNMGPIYRAKKADADLAQAELDQIKSANEPLIAEKETAIMEMDQQIKADIAALERTAFGGFAGRIDALHRLGQQSDAIWWASLFIMLLFIAVETAPIFVKLISSRSPYDYLLHQHEHEFAMAHREVTTLRNNEVNNRLQEDTEVGVYRLKANIKARKAEIDADLERRLDGIRNGGLSWD
jgi:hypothetical protein